MPRVTSTGARRRSRRDFGQVSLALVVACVAVFLIIALLELSGVVGRGRVATVFGVSYSGVFHHHRYFQVATSHFVHGGIAHLAFNMLAIWMLAPMLERHMGRRRFVWLIVVSALAADAGFLACTIGTSLTAIGSSGIVFGVLTGYAMLFPESVLWIFGFFPIRAKYAALLLGAIELYLTVIPDHTSVAHSAHLFGAVGAWLLLRRTSRRPKARPVADRAKRRTPAVRRSVVGDIPKHI